MPLWNTTDANTGAPKFACFGGLGVAANGNVLFGNTQVNAFKTGVALGVDGLTTAEKANTPGPGHAGWVNRKTGTGSVETITLTNGGAGYANGNGFITFSGGNGSGANASYTTNAANAVVSVTLVTKGNGYTTAPTATVNTANSGIATFTVTVGGRAGRISYETLVASGNIH